MRHFTLDPQGAQIPVEFDEERRQIWIAGVRVMIIEVTNTGGIRLQAWAQVRDAKAGRPWTEVRTYIFSGAQFWKLVSGQLVDDPEQVGLFEAKKMMVMNAEILAKLQRHRGYQGWRTRPYPPHPTQWLAESYTFLGHGNSKGWRALRDAKGDYRTFTTPEQAYSALLALQKELEDLENQFDPE
jgi:hypothetical protein